MLQGVVSLLDDNSERDIRSIWKRLEDDFGLSAVQSSIAPHFSWHVAEEYDQAALRSIINQIACQLKPFRIKTCGLGMFLSPEPVLFVQITMTQQLLDIHRQIFKSIEPCAINSLSYYFPDSWTPHITLAYQDLREEQLSGIIAAIHQEDFERQIRIDNFALMCPFEDAQLGLCRVDFSGI